MAMKIFSDISLLLLIPWVLVCFLGAFFYYRKQRNIEGVSTFLSGILVTLVGLGLFILGRLLWGILFESDGTN